MKLKFLFLFIYSSSVFALPSWVSSPASFCKKTELCAVGSGETLNLASADARASIAKSFESKVKSEFSSLVSSDTEYADSKVSEEVDLLLKGAVIKESTQDKEIFYALASLNKMKAALEVKKEIDKIDAQMEELYHDLGVSGVSKILNLYEARFVLASKYRFLTGIDLPEKITYQNILKKKKSLLSRMKFFIEYSSSYPTEIKEMLAQFFSKKELKFYKNKKDADYILQSEFKSKKAYMKVEGFVKYNFVLTIRSLKKDKVFGTVSVSLSETGRDYEQALYKVIPKIEEDLENNFINLNIH